MPPQRRRNEPWAAKLGTSTLDPLQVMDLQDAVRKRSKTVELQGRKFNLRYEDRTVHYSPAEDGVFAPSGYLEIDRLLEEV